MEADANKTCSFAAWRLKSLFDFKGERGKNITVQCKLCKPREKLLSTSKSSTSNLKKHLVRKHSSVYESQFPEGPPASRLYEMPGQSSHCQDRNGELSPENLASDERPAKQAKSSYYINKAMQRKVNALVFNFIIDGVQPFSILEQSSFVRLVEGLQTGRGLMCPKTMVGKVWWAFHSMKEALSSKLREVQAVCTTADAWTAHGRSYLAVSCHWIEESTLERKSAALACMPLQGPATCEAVVAKLSEVHSQFDLQDKVACMVTDSGSGFVPVFREFCGHGGKVPAEVAFEGVNELLESDVKELQFLLPTHQRCSAHVLSRIARSDVEKELSAGPSQELYRGAMAKCASIWKLAHSSALGLDFLEDVGSMKVLVPHAATWSSEYHAIRKMLSFSDSQMQEACERQGVELFSAQEVLFLQEYSDVLQPLAYSLDFIQSEKKCILGYLLPTLLTLKSKLREIKPFVRFSARLIDALLASIDTQFDRFMSSREAKIAAMTVPKLRMWWVAPDERDEMQRTLLEEAALEERLRAGREGQGAGNSDSDSESEEKFFGFVTTQSESKSTAEVEVLNYLQDTDKAMASLNKYPTIKRLFIKYNTTLPSGAGAQRLFSHNGHILTPEHTGISEDHFEQVLLLRYNQELCPLTNEGWHWS